MATKKSPTEKAAEGRDPTVRGNRGADAYPEGTHPPVSTSDATWGAPDRFGYRDLNDDEKPDPSTVAQEMTKDSMRDKADKALADDADKAASSK